MIVYEPSRLRCAYASQVATAQIGSGAPIM